MREYADDGEGEGDRDVDPPAPPVLEGPLLLQVVLSKAERAALAKEDGEEDAKAHQTDAAVHAPRDDELADELAEGDVTDELHRLERHEDRRRREREREEVDDRRGDKQTAADGPQLAPHELAAGLSVLLREPLEAHRLQVLPRVDADAADDVDYDR